MYNKPIYRKLGAYLHSLIYLVGSHQLD